MHGAPWRIRYEKELLDRKLKPIPRSQQTMFRGVGGDAYSDTVYNMPAGIANNPFAIESAELDQDAPLLISKDTQSKLGT
eukprot:5912347-Pyramimonas_sp.AAC.1